MTNVFQLSVTYHRFTHYYIQKRIANSVGNLAANHTIEKGPLFGKGLFPAILV